MSTTVYKYPLGSLNDTTIEIPSGAEILTLQTHGGIPYIWALVNPNNPLEERKIETYDTYDRIPMGNRKYIGTYQLHGGALVFHVFEFISGEHRKCQ